MDVDYYKSAEFGERFEANYTPEPNSGCWLWTGGTTRSYGSICFKGRQTLAHRASYQRSVGPLSPNELVMHLCDNKACVNPEHLQAGSNSDNMRDYFAKLRTDRGAFLRRSGIPPSASRQHLRKFSAAEVLAIRASTASNRRIADLVGAPHTIIGFIKRGLAYTLPSDSVAVPDPVLAERLAQLRPSAKRPSDQWEDRRRKAMELRASGASFTEIARQLGVARSHAFAMVQPLTHP